MNVKSIIATVALLTAAGAAMAGGFSREQIADNSEAAQGNVNQSTSSTLTREEVIAATKQALASGQVPRNEAYDSDIYYSPRVKNANVEAQLAAKTANTKQQ
jgi:predicted lactoylglutathione lyase